MGSACTGSTQHVSLPLSQITGVSILRAGETMEQALTAVCKDIRLGKILIQTNLDTGEPEVSPAGAWHTAVHHWQLTNHASCPPQLHYLRLPKEISEDYVILMDSTVSTGAAAMMAVRVLLVRGWLGGWGTGDPLGPAAFSCPRVPQDHDVQEDRIFLLSLLMAEMGVHSVAYAFPRVRIITTAVDKRVNEEFHIIPGIGEGDQGVLCLIAGASNPRASLAAALKELWWGWGCCPFTMSFSLSGNFGDRYFGTDGPSAWCESDSMDC